MPLPLFAMFCSFTRFSLNAESLFAHPVPLRKGAGAAKAAILEENRSRLKGSKRRAKELGLSINSAKRDLDMLKVRP